MQQIPAYKEQMFIQNEENYQTVNALGVSNKN